MFENSFPFEVYKCVYLYTHYKAVGGIFQLVKKKGALFLEHIYEAQQTGFDEDLREYGNVRGCWFDVLGKIKLKARMEV
ncbi:hypothetical protein ACQCVP_15960 [Rossellomorea vietnamensis]